MFCVDIVYLTLHTSHIPRVMDVDIESEDEDAIIERRRQLRLAIVQKYQSSQSSTKDLSGASTPASTADRSADFNF